MNENTEAQTYMQPKAQFQNTIRDLETKIKELTEQRNNLLLNSPITQKELNSKVIEILKRETGPGGILYGLNSIQNTQQDKNEQLTEQVNAKLERVKELNEKVQSNRLECALLREKEIQQKYETTLLGLVDLVEDFGGDSGAIMNWNWPEFIKNAKPEEALHNVRKTLKELEKDSEQRAMYRLADALISYSKAGKASNQSIIKQLKAYYPEMNVSLLMDLAGRKPKNKKTKRSAA
jgi:hypothetical protein